MRHDAPQQLHDVFILSYNQSGRAASLVFPLEQNNNRDFRGDEIDILETAFGKLVTVTIAHVPDLHIIYLTVLIPSVYLPKKGEEFSIETIAIITTHNTPFTGPQGNPDGLQVDTYETIDLEGTARFIVS